MLKSLRLTMLGLLAMVSSLSFADTTVTFTAGTDKGTQTNAGVAGDKVSKDGITIETTSGNSAFAAAQYRFAKGSVTTFSSTVGNITKVEFTCTVEGTKQYGPGCFTNPSTGSYTFSGNKGTWTGEAASFTLTASSNQVRATNIVVTVGNGGDTPTPTPTEVTEVANIAAFNALAEGTEAKLKLTNAQVLYSWTSNAGNNSTYIKDATGALLLYKSGLTLTADQIVNGKVVLQRTAYNNMIQGTEVSGKTNADSLTITAGTAVVPTEITIAQASSNVANLVTIKNVKIISKVSGQYTNYYAISGTDTIQVYNKFHLENANIAELNSANVTGIIEKYRTYYEICPTTALNGEGGDTPTPTVDAKNLPYEETFAEGQGDFTITEKVNADNLSDVWSWDSGNKYMKANAYKSAKAHDYVGYLVSPLLNLTSAKKPQLTFEHAGRFFHSDKDEATLWVITENGDTTQVAINHYFTNKDWTMVKDTVNLSSFIGKNVKIAFRYSASAANGKDAGTWEIKNFKVADTASGGTVTPADTVKAANIAAFLALAENTNAQLQLTDAQVLYTWTSNGGNNSTFVRDASGALLLYNAGLDLSTNQIVNGKVMLNRSQYNKMPQAKAISGSTTKEGLTITDGSEAAPVEITPAEAANNVANLVLLKGVTIKANSSRYYAFAGNDSVQLFNGFYIENINIKATDQGEVATVKGIVERYNSTYEVYPIEITTVSTGINEINAKEALKDAPVYNLAGQRVDKNYRGVVIINGKKYLNK